jgi:hypothetical protein
MNISSYLFKIPYQILWRVHKFIHQKKQVDFLCGSIVDYICFQNIHILLPHIRIVARNKKVQQELLAYGIKASLYPNFPDVIIMARHLTRKYPVKAIKKIGMTHGAYNFKKLISVNEYNAFDKYIFTSSHKEKEARRLGINCGTAVGYCKMDKAFSEKKLVTSVQEQKLKLDPEKKTIIFTATWDKKGYSAIEKWYRRLSELTDDYNVLVTVHSWTSKQKINTIKKTKNIKYIVDKNILPYLLLSDLMIGDTSSILGEFCALNKPIITFKIPLVGRMTEETQNLLEDISFRISDFEELKAVLPFALENSNFHEKNRKKWNQIMFDDLDGKASIRAVEIIQKIIEGTE